MNKMTEGKDVKFIMILLLQFRKDKGTTERKGRRGGDSEEKM